MALVERVSFAVRDDRLWQYTCGNAALHAWFERLHNDKTIDRRCSFDKARGIKIILSNAGLIRCLDPNWRAEGEYDGQRITGVCQKWGLGPTHPRYEEFQRVLKTSPPLLLPPRKPVPTKVQIVSP